MRSAYYQRARHVLMAAASCTRVTGDRPMDLYRAEYAVGRAVEAAHLLNSPQLLSLARAHAGASLRTEMATVVEALDAQQECLEGAGAGRFESEYVPSTYTPHGFRLIEDTVTRRGKVTIAYDSVNACVSVH